MLSHLDRAVKQGKETRAAKADIVFYGQACQCAPVIPAFGK